MERYALVLLTVELDYLTADGEETEESGWDDVEKHLAEHLRRFPLGLPQPYGTAKFIEWQDYDV